MRPFFSFHLQPLAIPYLVGTLGHGRAEKELLQLMTPLVGELEKKLKGKGHLVGVRVRSCPAFMSFFLVLLLLLPFSRFVCDLCTVVFKCVWMCQCLCVCVCVCMFVCVCV